MPSTFLRLSADAESLAPGASKPPRNAIIRDAAREENLDVRGGQPRLFSRLVCILNQFIFTGEPYQEKY